IGKAACRGKGEKAGGAGSFKKKKKNGTGNSGAQNGSREGQCDTGERGAQDRKEKCSAGRWKRRADRDGSSVETRAGKRQRRSRVRRAVSASTPPSSSDEYLPTG